jgi:TonB family protein
MRITDMSELLMLSARASRAFLFLLLTAGLLVSARVMAFAQEDAGTQLFFGARPADFDESQRDLDSPPALRDDLHIAFPAEEQRRGHAGIVIVRAAIDARGEVTYAIVTKRCAWPALDSAALRAVAEARFIPARRDGREVAARLTIPVQFSTATPGQVYDVEKTTEELRDETRQLEKAKRGAADEQKAIEEEIRRLKERKGSK